MMVTSIFIGGVAWANITDKLAQHETQFATINSRQDKQEQATNDIQQTAARTEQKVDDIASNIQDLKQWMRGRDGH